MNVHGWLNARAGVKANAGQIWKMRSKKKIAVQNPMKVNVHLGFLMRLRRLRPRVTTAGW